ncbi:hypothetical protein Moror_2980 [Moniliophthora roreri MCA 2997]|uniref:HMG box domain-containing protein n=2 Tax=Moniliophthora roreri TaxID=221103 RepID=V2WPG6_MONRO|nr:hypothetical protein Moror_2980 [Moniliophthora roreri MCA 2997]KAI3596578.1 hypothetical protein WG66_003405 [Moniliophthora roreri]
MPAERSRGSRRSGADGNQLVWTMPVEPASSSGIAFATNLTPVTFNEPTTDSTSKESSLFPSVDEASSPRRNAHSKKKPDNHIPRPPNAFILFRSSFIKSQHVSTEVETNHSTLSKIIGLTWQNLPDDERQVWHAKAKVALDEHKRKFPQYAFRPLHTKAKGGTEKRKVREVGPKDLKRCAKIAELLVEGKKGQDLDAAIQEFDKYHVPEIVTRFEAPITEETFQRSAAGSTVDSEAEYDSDEPKVPRRSSGSRSPSKSLSRSSSSRNISRRAKRSESPGPPPPLIDPEHAEEHFRAMHGIIPSNSQDFSLSPLPPFDDPYSFSSNQEHSFDFNTFTLPDHPQDSPVPKFESACGVDSLMSEASYAFGDDATTTTARKPSLSINTSLPLSNSQPSLQSWTPMSSSDSLNIPVTPCYSDGPSYTPFNAYLSNFNLQSYSHSPSPLSNASSYEDLSSMYRSDCHSQPQTQCVPSSPECGYTDATAYTNELPVFVQGQDVTSPDFLDAYSSLSMPMSPICNDEDVTLSKAKLQGQFHPPNFDMDFTSLVGTIHAY